jgi:hypothetical protein
MLYMGYLTMVEESGKILETVYQVTFPTQTLQTRVAFGTDIADALDEMIRVVTEHIVMCYEVFDIDSNNHWIGGTP